MFKVMSNIAPKTHRINRRQHIGGINRILAIASIKNVDIVAAGSFQIVITRQTGQGIVTAFADQRICAASTYQVQWRSEIK